MKRTALTLLLAIIFLIGINPANIHAQEDAELEYTCQTDCGSTAVLSDGSYDTYNLLTSENYITISTNEPMKSIYVIWYSPVVLWTITADDFTLECGENGFLHEYVELDTPTTSLTITIPEGQMNICDIRVFGEGEIPSDVQIWNPPCEQADILLIPTHADDEILFFGGIIPTYTYEYDAQVQVIYICEFWSTEPVREHEKLDGLWASGLKNYPECGNFLDRYSTTLETALTQYSFDDMTAYIVAAIRKFKPQVIVTHDFYGEYGHGGHMITAEATKKAVESAIDETIYPESAIAYGTWDTPKSYYHLYGENSITLDLRQPISEMDNRTALEIATYAYTKHVSQQRWAFYVSDDYEHSCADFGLYRSTVGADTEANLLCNLKTYKAQAEEAEAASIAESMSIAESIEESISVEESISESIEESVEESIEESISVEESVEESISIRESESIAELVAQAEAAKAEHTRNATIAVITIVLGILVTGFLIYKLKKK